MARKNPMKMCFTCRQYEPYHCTLDDSYIGYLYVEEPTKCRAWELHDDYKQGGKFYEPAHESKKEKKIANITLIVR